MTYSGQKNKHLQWSAVQPSSNYSAWQYKHMQCPSKEAPWVRLVLNKKSTWDEGTLLLGITSTSSA